MPGCPANQPTNEEGLTPQKIAKTEGFKDAMKELKKLTTFQDKIERGAKPKGSAEDWAVRVSIDRTPTHAHTCTPTHPPTPPPHTHTQLYDWVQVNRQVVTDVLKEQDPDKSGVIPTQQFTTSLEGIGIPLQSEEFEKLIRVYDKKGEGKLNYDDFLTEQKYIHAVSINTLNLGNSNTMQECTYSYRFTRI